MGGASRFGEEHKGSTDIYKRRELGVFSVVESSKGFRVQRTYPRAMFFGFLPPTTTPDINNVYMSLPDKEDVLKSGLTEEIFSEEYIADAKKVIASASLNKEGKNESQLMDRGYTSSIKLLRDAWHKRLRRTSR